MTDRLKLYVFGDQTYDVQSQLHNLLGRRDNPILEDFLQKAYRAIRAEIHRLPPQTREDVPRFTSVDDLLLWNRPMKRCIPLDMALTCLAQLGTLISQDGIWDAGVACRVLGLCTGALAAAAVSCSGSALDLVPLAVVAVTVAFRTGILVTDVAERVTSMDHGDASWSMVVPGSMSAEVVQQFCRQSVLPLTSQPYISAYAPNGVTVSGPPPALAQLLASDAFQSLRHKSLPIYAPYHAPHLYSDLDIQEIVGDLTSASAGERLERIPLISIAEAETGRTFALLLKTAIQQILLHPIRWPAILTELERTIRTVQPESFSVVPIGTTADQLIYSSLRQTPLRLLLPLAVQQGSRPATPQDADPLPTPTHPTRCKLAIVGMSGRFPGASDKEAFWDLLYQGLDVHKPAPPQRWNVSTHVDPTGSQKNTSATAYGCWLDEAAGFDARFFNISPREAPQIDPAQRLALMTAYEAIEQAGIVADATPSTRRDRVGVFYGVTSNDWMETNSAQNIDTYFIPGGNRAFIPGRINYCFKFSGPSYAVDTACSSSLAGIHIACNALWRGDIDTAIAGGTNVLTNPDFTAGLDRGHFLSRTGNCKTFDDGADGYCRGEGVGTVIIKRLDDALADHDPILGVILGASTNHSAESESITRPHVGAQRAIFSTILNQAAVDPYSVSYVEMHGTGTQAGDAGEMSSVLDTFAPPLSPNQKARNSQQALYLGSAKSNIGHGEAASGVSSLIKVLLMMQKNIIVPHCGIKTKLNHRFPTDLDQRNVHIAQQPTQWERNMDSSQPRRVFVNNFSAAGGNSALLIEDAPLQVPIQEVDPRSSHLIAISAKNGVSLQGNLRSLLAFLRQTPDFSLSQLSYTTTARRQHHPHRVMLSASTVQDLTVQIEAALRDNSGMTRPKSVRKVVFTFTGQGAQYPGMGKQLFQNLSFFRTEMCRLDQIGISLGFPSMLPVIQSEEQDIGEFAPMVVQLASISMQIALRKLWASWNITPSAVVGHSLGEYSALNAAGILSDTDTIYLVGKRAELLQATCQSGTHAMLVVKGAMEEVSRILKDFSYEIACINSPVETVLAGLSEDISALTGPLSAAGMKSTLLRVPYAFHSSQLEPMLADFEHLAGGVTFSDPKIPILCPLDGGVVESNGDFDGAYLARHSREPVNMYKALQTAHSRGIITDQTTVVEIGSHPAISGMVRAVLGTQVTSLASMQRGRPAWQVLSVALKALYQTGADIRWSEIHRDFKSAHKVLPLPAYSWDLKDYWIQYVNDWSLRKGDAPLVINAPGLESTTIHRVVEETGDSLQAHLVVEADIAREDLSPLVQGHEVDGIPLCTPSVYADIALTLGTYLLRRYQPQEEDRLVDVSNMTISKALILRPNTTQQLLQAHADVEWSSQSATVKFVSFNNKQELQEHARCVISFRDRSIVQQLQDKVALEKEKIQALRDGIAPGITARFNRPMVYRAIRPLARFHDDYRAIDEIVLDSNTLEATSHLSFGSVKRGGNFHTHPAIIDALTQSCGFTMNCNDYTDLDNEVFMNHGWGSFQIFEPLDFDKKYVTYTRMEEGADKLWHGDVTILDGDKVVAFFGQIAIQGVPRRVLQVILSLESGSRQKGPRAPEKQPAAPRQSGRSPVAGSAPVPTRSQGPDKASRALAIIGEESGIAVADLTDSTNFQDVGIDSLLALTISARFAEELDTELDFNAMFFDYPTVADLRELFGGDSGTMTPGGSDGDTEATDITPPDAGDQLSNGDFAHILSIIAEESGISVDNLTEDTNFVDSGIDSLLSLVIVSRFRDGLGLDIQHETLFLDCPTVGDLKALLVDDPSDSSDPVVDGTSAGKPIVETIETPVPVRQPEMDPAALTARKDAVDAYLQKYLAGYSGPSATPESSSLEALEKVVLVTGASGSLGSHLVYHLAQLPDIKTVICLNRDNRTEPYARQQKAMRDKGIRFPEALKPKLVVLQADTSQPRLGLSPAAYDTLVTSVTHLIHNGWPMSAKRPLSGFESQFQVMRNLIDLAGSIVSKRPSSFKFSFQMVSSIGVVGHYGLADTAPRAVVPEDRVDIDAVLTNGYSEAKWGCERMLDATLHHHPDQFRVMAVRLGQIAGSKTSGYWNPMEHFGFLVKSSQTLNALPDVDGHLYWTPVNDIAGTLCDLVLADHSPYPVYHIDNPVGQPWREMNQLLAHTLGIKDLIPFEQWVERVRAAPQRNNPASMLLEFLDSNYLRMSCGGLVLDVQRTLEHSKTLAAVGPVSEEVVRKYVHIWKEIGFLH
ncbi:ketoacyl-synt-domain-containing protein [Aspergillus sclerotioniger CBS 115572]|uniref:Ketoacyl-synt-domain-containing protein n=1 Tax=Aspergillus sclerotioniger CBS 115572 TaxID=1450535 RepID=A0A317VBN6_9EURO|nr:ketoacyl-synt-domain-containing protein [Aspergillus sclerotioniger CBS 115572]PWY71773.1 ketoacyl-synt-domain-containing protein [Aspergillus sclerotioniger CBS 115572]